MRLFRDEIIDRPGPAPGRKLVAMVGALAVHGLTIAVFLALDGRENEPIPEARSLAWLYLPPLHPAETTSETDHPADDTIVPEPNATQALSVEDLRVIAPGFLPVPPSGSFPETRTALGLGRYFSCRLENFDSLAHSEKRQCAKRLAALQKERDLLHPDSLPFVLTSSEAEQWRIWERNLLERQAPLLLPCLNASGFLTINRESVDCFVATIENGYRPDNNPRSRYAELP